MPNEIRQFLHDHGISEVEAIIPDMAGIARGKIMPAAKFAEDEGMRLPESIFLQTVTGDYPSDTSGAMSPTEIDIVLKADPKTVRRVPWAAEPTAQVIHDCLLRRWPPSRHGTARRAAWHSRTVCRARLGADRGAGTGVLPGRAEYRRRLPTETTGGAIGACRAGSAVLQHRGGQRIRSVVR